MRRCAISVAANIAEGAGSDSELHFARYVGIARASAAELRYHLIYARDVGYVTADAYAALDDELDQIRRMLTVLARTIRTNAASRRG